MSHIFISYSSKDIEFARYFRAGLQNAGVPVWMDEEGINLGQDWLKSIESALNNAVALVVLMSHHSRHSDWVNREIQYAEDIGLPIFPVLLNGEPFFRLREKQYEDMTAGTQVPISATLLRQLTNTLPGVQKDVTFHIDQDDILEIDADIIVLKYAQSFYGADLVVYQRLREAGIDIDMTQLEAEGHLLLDPQSTVRAEKVLFVATPALRHLDYVDLRAFCVQAFSVAQATLRDMQSIAMTVHGVSIGLDEGEVLRAQLGGILDALKQVPMENLARIHIAEIRQHRFENLRQLADNYLTNIDIAQRDADTEAWSYRLSPQAIKPEPTSKDEHSQPSVTVFFPDDSDLEDIYYYGILRPAGMQGFLCENVGMEMDVSRQEELQHLERFLDRANLIIVYIHNLDVLSQLAFSLGVAYGKDKKIAFVLPPDAPEIRPHLVANQTVIQYRRISDLETSILELLRTPA